MIELIKQALTFIDSELNNFKISTNEQKVKISATLLVISIDHAHGIINLLENRIFSSAFALLRIQFETYLRGMWFAHCANQKQINYFLKKDKIIDSQGQYLHFQNMVEDVENVCKLSKILSGFSRFNWNDLNSFTHGGVLQAVNNFNGKSIVSNYTEIQLKRLMYLTNMLAYYTFAGLMDHAKPSNGQQIYKKLQDLLSELEIKFSNIET